EILSALSDVEHIQELKLCLDPENYDYHLTSKFRGVDPLVMVHNAVRRVTDIYPEVRERFEESKKRFQDGYYIRVVRG
ncbi:MAG: hypothetical protein HYW81_02575, partial [Parcubacteria group bacterium]|nr:hypothetical protein [Parcubacteria group bacterium]